MKKIYLLLITTFVMFQTANATVWRVNNRPNVNADFTTLQAAINGASDGNTLYFRSSTTNYGNDTFDKQFIVIGAGYWLDQNDTTPLSDGIHQLYVRVKDENNKWSLIYTEEIEKVIPNKWLGTVDTVWNNAANWSYNAVPTSVDFVLILNVTNHPVINNINADCYSVEVDSGAVLIVKDNGTLNMVGE